jgi:hypothetical protein
LSRGIASCHAVDTLRNPQPTLSSTLGSHPRLHLAISSTHWQPPSPWAASICSILRVSRFNQELCPLLTMNFYHISPPFCMVNCELGRVKVKHLLLGAGGKRLSLYPTYPSANQPCVETPWGRWQGRVPASGAWKILQLDGTLPVRAGSLRGCSVMVSLGSHEPSHWVAMQQIPCRWPPASHIVAHLRPCPPSSLACRESSD